MGGRYTPLSVVLERYPIRFAKAMSPGTMTQHTAAIKRMVECFGPDRTLKSLMRSDCVRFYEWLGERGVHDSTRQKICVACKAVYKRVRHKARRNPWLAVPMYQFDAAPKTYVDADTFERILAHCPNARWKLLYMLARHAALRHGEIMRIWPEDVRLSDDGTYWELHVNAPRHGRSARQTTKRRHRIVPLRPHLALAVLDDKRIYDWYGVTPIFSCHVPQDASNRRKIIRRIHAKAGVPNYGAKIHALRASAIRDMCRDFQDPILVAKIAGVSPQVIAKHYFPVKSSDLNRFLGA